MKSRIHIVPIVVCFAAMCTLQGCSYSSSWFGSVMEHKSTSKEAGPDISQPVIQHHMTHEFDVPNELMTLDREEQGNPPRLRTVNKDESAQVGISKEPTPIPFPHISPVHGPRNVGHECWNNGGCSSSAHCEYCGTGKCCRQGWQGGDPRCLADEGDVGTHVCVESVNRSAPKKLRPVLDRNENRIGLDDFTEETEDESTDDDDDFEGDEHDELEEDNDETDQKSGQPPTVSNYIDADGNTVNEHSQTKSIPGGVASSRDVTRSHPGFKSTSHAASISVHGRA